MKVRKIPQKKSWFSPPIRISDTNTEIVLFPRVTLYKVTLYKMDWCLFLDFKNLSFQDNEPWPQHVQVSLYIQCTSWIKLHYQYFIAICWLTLDPKKYRVHNVSRLHIVILRCNNSNIREPLMKDHHFGHKKYGLSRQVVFVGRFSYIEMWNLLPGKWSFKTGGLSWQWSLKIGFTVQYTAVFIFFHL